MGMYAGHFDFRHPLVWTVPGLFTAAECADILAGIAGAEWLAATVNRAEGRAVDARVRDNTVAIVRDPALAGELFRRVRPHVPARMSAEIGGKTRADMDAAGVFLPLRVYRYEVGQHFGLHEDQSYFGKDGEMSLLTLLVYLNDGFEGGETEFPEQQRTVAPVTGAALLFQHRVLHAGNRVSAGTKYVLRTDVLYRPAGGQP
jgi:prolyl 4-hydroxylase